jgi:hypothetical protein
MEKGKDSNQASPSLPREPHITGPWALEIRIDPDKVESVSIHCSHWFNFPPAGTVATHFSPCLVEIDDFPFAQCVDHEIVRRKIQRTTVFLILVLVYGSFGSVRYTVALE